ncbi:MAG: hypothetical protein K8F25_09690 [Fimbriimonadaceae bacterium]|nr:hypothetical protein [Alphaproteobacteria bacterium]
MSLAISSALSGLQAASARLTGAARTIAGTNPANPSAINNVQTAERPSGKPDTASGSFAETGVTKNLVDIKQAEISYKANAKVLSVLARTEEGLLDILS